MKQTQASADTDAAVQAPSEDAAVDAALQQQQQQQDKLPSTPGGRSDDASAVPVSFRNRSSF